MDMIERVARAMLNACRVRKGLGEVTLEAMADPDRAEWIADARAAIEAMRECSPAMIKAGEDMTDTYYSNEDDFKDGWNAAINAALREGQ